MVEGNQLVLSFSLEQVVLDLRWCGRTTTAGRSRAVRCGSASSAGSCARRARAGTAGRAFSGRRPGRCWRAGRTAPPISGMSSSKWPVGSIGLTIATPLRAAGGEVVLTERGGLVHQPGAVLGGDVVLVHHEVRVRPARAVGARRPLDELEGALVGPADHVGAANLLADRPPLAECPLDRVTPRRPGSPRRCWRSRRSSPGAPRPARWRPASTASSSRRAGAPANLQPAYGPEVRGKRT